MISDFDKSVRRTGQRLASRPGLTPRVAMMSLVRIVLLCGAVMIVIAIVSLRAAEASLALRVDGILTKLSMWPGGSPHGRARLLSVNGLEVNVLTTTLALPLEQALGVAQRRCKHRGGFEPEQLKQAAVSPAALAGLGSLFDGVLTWQSEGRGIVACLDTGGAITLEELAERAKEYAKSGDLQALGEFRFAQARGDDATSTLLWLWTEGRIELESLFPRSGDAPGFDPRGFKGVRPGGARRLLSATEHGTPFAFAVYQHPTLSVTAATSEMVERARKHGFTATREMRQLILQRGAEKLIVQVVSSAKNGVVIRVSQLARA